jgi:cytochrome oxidase Cu insertion factor (SCO1/SenC/PrrC family)
VEAGYEVSRERSGFLDWLARVVPLRAQQYRGGLVSPPLPKPSFTLVDTSGARFDFRAKTENYVTLLFFGYTFVRICAPCR